jgi:hypothetical protein
MTSLQLRNCEFAFKCDADWHEMDKTQNEKIRFCNACKKQVHHCETDNELLQAIKSNLCVAIPAPYASITGQMLAGSMRFKPLKESKDNSSSTLKYVTSIKKHEWDIWAADPARDWLPKTK